MEEGYFWKVNHQLVTKFLHVGISWGRAIGYLEIEVWWLKLRDPDSTEHISSSNQL